eukprot:7057335-Pyramimonas_sp.AAC.1
MPNASEFARRGGGIGSMERGGRPSGERKGDDAKNAHELGRTANHPAHDTWRPPTAFAHFFAAVGPAARM